MKARKNYQSGSDKLNMTQEVNGVGVNSDENKKDKTPADYTIKCLAIGDTAVGKTCLIYRYTEDTFSPIFISTVGKRSIIFSCIYRCFKLVHSRIVSNP